ncbi:hypothetical protein MGYG_05759 [Nannizzia gypsea CBS 118893]|uniref:Uncharacterized protein n=1 Tax=Arthroderma gypseum (strain ATCC MYA-4604 / CBS 118893) TaxID=535722 RepID=E4UXM6_ARTGP|nr:hypothetical protein MGYG_05759 [Nannizzia gypsea CBS 118893]EFR02760.1 hypothetical protein MGYG_05759 [Nannizzia gypsea CBS 118893]
MSGYIRYGMKIAASILDLFRAAYEKYRKVGLSRRLAIPNFPRHRIHLLKSALAIMCAIIALISECVAFGYLTSLVFMLISEVGVHVLILWLLVYAMRKTPDVTYSTRFPVGNNQSRGNRGSTLRYL